MGSREEFLREKGQEHLLAYFEQLSPEKQEELDKQLVQLDWKELDISAHTGAVARRGAFTPIPALEIAQIEVQKEEYEKLGYEGGFAITICFSQKTVAELDMQ